MIERYTAWIMRHRAWCFVGILGVVVWLGSGMRFLEFSNDYRVYFSEDNPQLLAYEALQNTYTKTDNILIAVAPQDGNVFSPRTLAAIEWLTEQAWTLPYAIRVESLTNFQHTVARGDDLHVDNLVRQANSLNQEQLDAIKRIAFAEPMLVNQLLSVNADVSGLNIIVDLPGKALSEVPQVMAEVRRLVDQAHAQYPELRLYISGGVATDNAFGEQSRRDLATLTPIMYGLIIVVTFIMLRSLSGTVAVVLVISFSTVCALGLAGWLGIKMTPPSAAAPTVILTLAVAHSIHVLMSIIQRVRAGDDKHTAIVASLKMNLYPISLAALTDVIGFLSMNFSEVPPFRDLGNIVTLGVLAAYPLAIVMLPLLVSVLPLHVRADKHTGEHVMDRIADFVIAYRRLLLIGMSVSAVVLVALIPVNTLNDNFVEYFDERVEFRRDANFINTHLSGLDVVEFSLESGSSGGVADPVYLAKLEEFAAWLRTQPGIVHVSSMADVMKRLNKNMHGDRYDWYRLPETRELAAQYLLLYEMSLPLGLDLNNQINVDKSASRMSVIMKSAFSSELLDLDERAHAWLKQHAPAAMLTSGTGPSMMFAYIGQRNIDSMIEGNIVALLLISAVLIFALRSLRLGFISLLPNLLPAGMAFGLWAIFDGQVGLALSVVVVMTYGIVVDDTIHSMSKYVEARRRFGMDAPQAVRYVFANVGMAAWAMTMILIVGFMVLAFSSFELNSSLGLMTAVIIALAWVTDFLLLPSLLMAFDRRDYVKKTSRHIDMSERGERSGADAGTTRP